MNNKELSLPLLIARHLVVFPNQQFEIEIERDYSVNAIKYAQSINHEVVMVAQQNRDDDNPGADQIHNVGTLCRIDAFIPVNSPSENGGLQSYKVRLTGLQRFFVSSPILVQDHNWGNLWMGYGYVLKPKNNKPLKTKDAINHLLTELRDRFVMLDQDKEFVAFNQLIFEQLGSGQINPSEAVDRVAAKWPVDLRDLVNIKQPWLNEVDVLKRIELILSFNPNMELSDDDKRIIEDHIATKLNDRISKQQKEYFLRERLKIIKEELGESFVKDEEINKIKTRLKNEPFPQHVKDKVLTELNKLEMSSMFSQESLIIKNYVDWMMSLPWWETSKDEQELSKVEQVLDQNHYGLEKVKERILEFLAVQKRKKNEHGSIICLVGPPGVGKTSLAVSIAEAMGKKFVKISLGGVGDESEIRGHRKTYLGSMPGRIIKGLKTAKVKNPVVLLDEIDKLKSDLRGDPASALLEVLDPAQNKYFSDHYIEEEFDLSQVMFIATANDAYQIPGPLRDRMELIELTSYTENEKLSIAKSHLVKEVLEEHGIKKTDLKFTDSAINYMIARYTREAGVRQLKRLLAKIARKFVLAQENDPKLKVSVDQSKVVHYLQKEIFDHNIKDELSLPGVVNGMAYTSYGGELLPIEVNYYKGKGQINITGNLEQTMRESTLVALSYVRANAQKFGVDHIDFGSIDINIHVPAGGIPKDGPSAGVTLTTAIISAFRNQAVSNLISMTGEITLRGKVMIIGGVKEKVISAVRAGITKIFLPEDDERYLVDVPQEVLSKVQIVLVKEYDTIFNDIFAKKQSSSSKNLKVKKTPKPKVNSVSL